MPDHLPSPHSVHDLASAVGMSHSAFSQHFVEAFGQTLMEMMKELRLRQRTLPVSPRN